MSRQHKSSNKTATTWQRHALAQACFMVAAGISTSAWAAPSLTDFTPGAAMSSTNATLGVGDTVDAIQSAGAYWSTGYNAQIRNYQLGSGQINGVMTTNSLFSTTTGAGSTPVSLNANNLMLYSYGNQNSNANLALNTLTSANPDNDGQLALNLQIFSGLANDAATDNFTTQSVLATATDTSLYINQTGKNAAALSLSSNNVGATLSLNTVSTSVTGATPSAYVSTTQGTSSVAYGDNNSTGTVASSTRGTTGSVNLSNLQSAFNAVGMAELVEPEIAITVRNTFSTTNLSSGISINANTLTTNNTSNEASSVFVATAGSSAFTGSVAVTNIQATKVDSSLTATTQLSNVKDSTIRADLVDGTDDAKVSGAVTVNANTVSAKTQGNTAGARTSTGSINVGNAIVFESSSNITGSTAPNALANNTGVGSAITTTIASGKADLLINSVQRNAGKNTFGGKVDNSSIETLADNLASGSIAQNNNTQTATATANLAGSLIDAGNTGSVGNIQANAAVINTQVNNAVKADAEVSGSTQQVIVGSSNGGTTITGSVSLNDNNILTTAEGNASASQLRIKASTLTVGGNGTGLVDLKPAATAVASSGLAASVLSVQANDSLTLTSSNTGNTVAAKFNDQQVSAGPPAVTPTDLAITGSQVSVNGNDIASTATANAASNAISLVAANAPGLNAGLGNSQRNTATSVLAEAGSMAAVGVSISAANVTNSSLSLNTNAVNATAKGNSASNSLNVQATNASGLAAVAGGLFASSDPSSTAADVGSSTAGVQANADFALANAQLNSGGTLDSVVEGSATISSATVNNSTLSANGNSFAGNTSVNSAGNTMSLSITNMTGMTAGLSSAQSVNVPLNSVKSETTGTVSINTAGAAINNGSSLTLNSNTISSAVSANTVVNALSLSATTASGRDLSFNSAGSPTPVPTTNAASTSIQSGVANATADFALANQQKITTGGFTATTTAATTVTADLTPASPTDLNPVVPGAIDKSSVTVNANSNLASVMGNRGTNIIELAVNNLSKPNTGLASSQISSGSPLDAKVVDAASTDLIAGGTGYLGTGNASDAQIAVTNNQSKATVLGNVVSNTLTLSGSQATGSTLPMADSTTTVNGSTGAVTTYASAALANWQTSSADNFNASVGDFSSDAQIFLTAGNVTNPTTRSTLSLNSNTLAASVFANDASNTLVLSATQSNRMTTALASGQSLTTSAASDTVTATTKGQVVLTAGTVTGLAPVLPFEEIPGADSVLPTLTANSNVIASTLRVNNVNNTQQLRGDQFTGQSTLVPAFGASTSSLVTAKSDLSMANMQQISGAGYGAEAKTEGNVSMVFGNSDYANASANSNALTADARGNSANNLSDVLVTGLNAASLGVVSAQSTDDFAVKATTTGKVQITGGTTSVSTTAFNDNASLTLNNNTLSATAMRNTADNTLTVQATNASGRAVGSRQSVAGSALTIDADYALGNIQTGSSGITQAATTSEVLMDLSTPASTDEADAGTAYKSQLTVQANSLTAYASGNSANNRMTLAMTQLTNASAAVSSFQTGSGAIVDADFDGRVKLTVGDVDTVALSMKDNSIKATAIGNVSGNKLDVTANTATGTGTGSVAAVATGSSATVNADFAVTNVQSLTAGASTTANTDGSINVATGAVTDSSLGLTGNSIASLAVGNSAGNTLLLNVAQQSGLAAGTSNGLTAAVSSSQTSQVTVSATTSPKDSSLFGIETSGVTESTITLSGNTASAVASKNEAFNTLTVSGANVFGRGDNVSSSVAGTSSVTGADFAVINRQNASGDTTATMSAGINGLSTGADGLSGSTVTVSNNSVLANASANTTGNSLNLSANNKLEASGVVNNVQSLADGAKVTSSVGSTTAPSALGVETGTGAGSNNVAVTNNLVKSTASANVATNVLNATATNGMGVAGAVSSPSGINTATPTFAVLNSQSTGAGSTVSSAVYGFNMGGAQLGGALNSGGSASVTGNVVQSMAYGNSASNAIQVSAMAPGLNTASTSITNVQYNLASVTATVVGVNMQVSGTNVGSANVNLGGNSIVAMAVGNRAVNTVTGR